MISSTEVCKLVGCSYRQLDYWSRNSVIVPALDAHGSGRPRGFTQRQVRVIAMINDLAALNAPGKVLRGAALSAELMPLADWIGTGFVDDVGHLTKTHPGGACWAIDLGSCAEKEELLGRELLSA